MCMCMSMCAYIRKKEYTHNHLVCMILFLLNCSATQWQWMLLCSTKHFEYSDFFLFSVCSVYVYNIRSHVCSRLAHSALRWLTRLFAFRCASTLFSRPFHSVPFFVPHVNIGFFVCCCENCSLVFHPFYRSFCSVIRIHHHLYIYILHRYLYNVMFDCIFIYIECDMMCCVVGPLENCSLSQHESFYSFCNV